MKPIMDARKTIIKSLQKITENSDIHLEFPDRLEHGDYSSNIAMVMFAKIQNSNDKLQTESKTQNPKPKTKSSRELAEELVQKLRKDKELMQTISDIKVEGPGFINFRLKKDYLIKVMQEVLESKEEFGKTDGGKGKKAIVEYSSPNIAKPFTVGHLRSTVVGDAVANLLQATGWEVLRDNHLGDWGTQFGKQIYAIKNLGEGSEEANITKIEESSTPVKELVALYVEFHKVAEENPEIVDEARAWFKKLEGGDEGARKLWQKCVDWSWKEFDEVYEKLGVKFSKEFGGGRGLGESYFEDKMEPVIKELEEKELLKEGDEGAKLVFFEDDKYPPAMILKKDGTSLYHTRELATDKYRKDNYDPDLVVNEVGAEQQLYFRQLFKMEKMLGWYKKDQRVHVSHGLIRFADRKMSTRKGNVIWLQEVLDQALKKADEMAMEKGTDDAGMVKGIHIVGGQDARDKISSLVAIGALKWNDLKRDPKTDIVFDWDEILNMQGNSGPYMQYTYARTRSVLRKAQVRNLKPEIRNKSEITNSNDKKGLVNWDLDIGNYLEIRNSKLEINDEELSLLRSYPRFSEIIQNASENYSPNLLCNYLYDLAQKYNTFYNKHKIIGSDDEVFRLALSEATGQTIKNGLKILGIQAPERM